MGILNKGLYAAIITVVATSVGAWAFAGGTGGGPPTDGQKGPKGIFGILDEDQQETVKAMPEENREETEGLREEMETLREELRELIQSEAASTSLNAKIEEIGALRTEMMKKQVNLRVEVPGQSSRNLHRPAGEVGEIHGTQNVLERTHGSPPPAELLYWMIQNHPYLPTFC